MLYMSFNSTWSHLVHIFYQHSPDLQLQITLHIEGIKLMNMVQLMGDKMNSVGAVDVWCPAAHGNSGHLIRNLNPWSA